MYDATLQTHTVLVSGLKVNAPTKADQAEILS